VHVVTFILFKPTTMFGCELSQTNIPQTSTAGTHTHRQHYSHIPYKRGKQAEKVVTELSTKDDPLKMVKQL
jgi:hypothetical protein